MTILLSQKMNQNPSKKEYTRTNEIRNKKTTVRTILTSRQK